LKVVNNSPSVIGFTSLKLRRGLKDFYNHIHELIRFS